MLNRYEVSIVRQGNAAYRSPVLIAARPGRMRDSLHTLLESMLGLNIVGHADDSAAALRMVIEQRPALVLLDTNLPGEGVPSVLKRIKANGSQSRCLVLADSVQQQREAQAAGADVALLKGFPAVELFESVEELLVDREAGKARAVTGPWAKGGDEL
jgi:DNA-binding NarL/FixJ family response regulator